MDIRLNFINRSDDPGYPDVVIFQRNVAATFDELAVAWKVIRFCGQDDIHPFTFPLTMAVAASDSYGNYTPPLQVRDGQLFQVVPGASGDQLVPAGSSTNSREVQVLNNLPTKAINAGLYRNGRLLAVRTSISPQQKAVFEFKPTLWIGVARQLAEGEVMSSAGIAAIDTELSLLGIASADIVMTGGGRGANSTPFAFHLQNIVRA